MFFNRVSGKCRINMAANNISRREFIKSAGLGVSTLALGSCMPSVKCSGKGTAKPNIVFIFSDDHAFQAISAYGGRLAQVAPTVNIDRIAKEGIRFDRCYVTNSICAPSRAVIQTGKHSHLNGVPQNGRTFDVTQQTFPKLLRASGYQTAMIGKWHLQSDPVGFDYWQVLPGQGHYYNPEFITEAGNITEQGYVTDIITDKALDWLKNGRDESKPFMLMLQHKAPHREWEPGPEHLTLFDNVGIPEPESLFDDYTGRGTAAHKQDMTIKTTMRLGADNKVWAEDEKDSEPYRRTYGRMNRQQRHRWDTAYGPKNEAFKKANLSGKELIRWKYQRYMKDYLRCIRSVDDNIGRVLDYLDSSSLAENTVVIYSSDQGFYLGEHGWFDKRFMYEESFRMPFVARWPGVIKAGRVNEDLVQNLDFAQTFLDIAGVAQPDDMQGASIKPILEGKTPSDWRKSLYYHYYEFPGTHKVRRHEGVATKRYKLIHFYNLNEWELYDLKHDPSEMKSVYDDPKYAAKILELKKELQRLRKLYKVPDNKALEM